MELDRAVEVGELDKADELTGAGGATVIDVVAVSVTVI